MYPDSTDQNEAARNSVDFDFAAVESALNPSPDTPGPDSETEALVSFNRREAACLILDILCAGNAGRKVIGARALALQYVLNAGTCENQNHLAKRMGVTPGRASQIIEELQAGLNSLGAAVARNYRDDLRHPLDQN